MHVRNPNFKKSGHPKNSKQSDVDGNSATIQAPNPNLHTRIVITCRSPIENPVNLRKIADLGSGVQFLM